MAKNKKPRKSYKARPIHSTGCFYSRADIDEVKDIINKAGLIFEIVLKTGRATELHMNLAEDVLNWGGMLLFDRCWKGQEATVDKAGLIFEIVLKTGRATELHMNLAEDVLNWGGMLLFDRCWKGQEATVDEFQKEHWKALHAFGAIVKRKNAGKTQGYVGTAEELEIISYVGGEVVRLLKEAMELAPFRTGAIVKRKNAGKTQGYVGTAEELEIISYVGGEVVRLLKEAMELAPFRTLKEFLAVRQIVGERVNQGGTKSIQGIEASARSVLNQRKFSRPEAPV